MHVSSTFWVAKQLLLMADMSTIPHLKGDIQGFHVSPKAAIVISDFLESMT